MVSNIVFFSSHNLRLTGLHGSQSEGGDFLTPWELKISATSSRDKNSKGLSGYETFGGPSVCLTSGAASRCLTDSPAALSIMAVASLTAFAVLIVDSFNSLSKSRTRRSSSSLRLEGSWSCFLSTFLCSLCGDFDFSAFLLSLQLLAT